MNKQELIKSIAKKAGLSKADSEKALRAYEETVISVVEAGGRVMSMGFGVFDSVIRNERMGRNPKTGEEIPIPAKSAPRFKAGKEFRDRVTVKAV